MSRGLSVSGECGSGASCDELQLVRKNLQRNGTTIPHLRSVCILWQLNSTLRKKNQSSAFISINLQYVLFGVGSRDKQSV